MSNFSETGTPDPKRWVALMVIAAATLMIVLDVSIINIALPEAQADLNISDANRPWVVTAYALTFGGLLLLGGRIADFFGRRRIFILGLVGFAAASAIGGFATNSVSLIAARGLQGVFGALLAPAALSLLTTTFTEPSERAKAFAVYGAVQGFGGAIGLLLGGALTEYLSWRWCLFVNVPIALVIILASIGTIRESRVDMKGRFDILGAILSMFGLAALVYGFTLAAEVGGFLEPRALTPIVSGVVLLVLFVVRQSKAKSPLLPLRVFTERNRAAAFLSLLLIGAGMYGMLLFLSFYLQVGLKFSPLQAGFAFLPFSIGIIAGSTVASNLVPRVGAARAMSIGLAGAVLGLIWLAQVTETSGFFSLALPAITLMSFGLGIYFVPASSSALTNVPDSDAGVASALVNATQQVGGAVGPAILNTIFLSSVAGSVVAGGNDIEGYRMAFTIGAVLFGLALVAVLLLARSKSETIVNG